jgi:hypothetical protein
VLAVATFALVSGVGLGDWSLPLAMSGIAVAGMGIAALPKLTRGFGNDTFAAFAVPFILFVALVGLYLVVHIALGG